MAAAPRLGLVATVMQSFANKTNGGDSILRRVLREVGEATLRAALEDGIDAVMTYAQCAQKLMAAARSLERPTNGSKQRADGHASEDFWAEAASYWKVHASKAAQEAEQYLVSSGCLRLAAACSMRAYRMGQKRHGGESDKAASNRVVTEVSTLSSDISVMVRTARMDRSGRDVSLRADQAGSVEQAMCQLASISHAIADFDQVRERSVATVAPPRMRT